MSTPKELESTTHADHNEAKGLSEKTLKHVGQGDEQVHQYVTDAPVEIDAATNKRLFWKINGRILVIQLVTYFFQSLDKGTLNFASVMGIKEDANLHGQEASPAAPSSFFSISNS